MKMQFKRWIAIILIFSSIIGIDIIAQNQQTLKDALKDKFLIGVAVNRFQTAGKDELSKPIITNQYNSITAENVLKWERVHPEPDKYNFVNTDQYIEFGEKNGMVMIGHTLVWHSQTPNWVFQDKDGKPVTREILLERMREHIKTVVGRYKGKIKGWDVVNEALDEDGSLRKSLWLNIIGEDYIAKAFEFAREADPDTELYYNDYSLENEPKCRGAIALVKNLLAQGIKVSAIGTQGHYLLNDPSISKVEKAINELSTTGIPVMITELDVNVLPTPFDNISADISLKADYQEKYNPYTKGLPDSVEQSFNKYYADLFALFVKLGKKINRVTFWGAHDGISWLNFWPIPGRTNYPLLFDRSGKLKPAFDAVIKAVK